MKESEIKLIYFTGEKKQIRITIVLVRKYKLNKQVKKFNFKVQLMIEILINRVFFKSELNLKKTDVAIFIIKKMWNASLRVLLWIKRCNDKKTNSLRNYNNHELYATNKIYEYLNSYFTDLQGKISNMN